MAQDIQTPIETEPLLRPRLLHELRDCVNHHAVTAITAGARGGKTTAARQLADTYPRCLWLNVQRMDNLEGRLWTRMLEGICGLLPKLRDTLEPLLGVPTLKTVDTFLSVWQRHEAVPDSFLIVLDDFQNTSLDEVYRILICFRDADLANLRVLVISARLSDRLLGGRVSEGSIGCLTARNLYFTPDEAREHLAGQRVLHTDNHILRIMEATGGWPYAVDVCVRQLRNRTQMPPGKLFDATGCMRLLQTSWVSPFDSATVQNLVKLSLLPVFPDELIYSLYGAEDGASLVDTLKDIPVAHHSDKYELYILEPLYQQCLLKESMALPQQETEHFRQQGWEWFMDHRELRETLRKTNPSLQRTETGFTAIESFALLRVSDRICTFLKEHARGLSEAYWYGHPCRRLLLARLYAEEEDYEEAISHLGEALDICLRRQDNSSQGRELLGEVYLGLAQIHLKLIHTNGMTYLKKAQRFLREASDLGQTAEWLIPNESTLAISVQGSNDMSKAVKMLTDAGKSMGQTFAGPQIHGFIALFTAEAAFATLDTARMERMLNEATRISLLYGQHTLYCNTMYLAARLDLMTGSGKNVPRMMTELDEYIQQRRLYHLQNCYDYLAGLFYMKMDAIERMPEVFLNPYVFSEMPERKLTCREMMLHCCFIINRGEYAQALMAICLCRQQAMRRRQFEIIVQTYLLEAYCRAQLGEPDRGLHAFQEAYGLAYPVGMIAPFVEMDQEMRTYIQVLKRTGNHGMDESWLDLIETKSSTYAKRMSSLKQQIDVLPKSSPQPVSLSPREAEVLHWLCDGLTGKEIGAEMHISINGVKRHIASLYDKLGAANRSNAIMKADALGLLKSKSERIDAYHTG